MAIATLRILTRKSKLGFGKYKNYTVQELLDLGREIELINPYFYLTSINFIEDILIELKITEEYRIPKPSSNKPAFKVFMKSIGKWKDGYKNQTQSYKFRGEIFNERIVSKISNRNRNQNK